MAPNDAIFATDVGQHQMWAAQFVHTIKPHQFITSGGLGTMGFGLPAAIGSQFANPDKKVICITGDGSIQMCIQEMMTAVVYELPIVIAIMNNKTLGMVRQWQELFFSERYSSVSLEASPNFPLLAEAYGAIGIRVDKPEDVEPAIARALAETKKPVLIDFQTPTLDKVYPFIPAGQTVDQMMLMNGDQAPQVTVDTDAETWSFADDERVLEEFIKDSE
jgi:acetolactate synthase-1/2/3 large subunit